MTENSNSVYFIDSTLTKISRAIRFNTKQQAMFLRALSDPMKYGRTALDVCRHIQNYGSTVQQELAAILVDSLSHGDKVTDALEGWVDPLALTALKAAEKGGTESFINAMEATADSLEISSEGRAKLIQKAAYPLSLAVLTIGIMIYPVYPLVGDLKALIGGKPNVALDEFSAVVEFYMYWLWIIVLVFVASYFGFKHFMANSVGEFRNSLDKISIFNGYRLSAGSKMVTIYAQLKRIGMPGKEIFEAVGNSGSRYMRYHCMIADDVLRAGVKTTEVEALDTGILDRSHISMLHLYTGVDSKVFIKALEAAAKKINEQIQARATIVAYLVSILFGCWAFTNIILIITVVIGFDPSKSM